MINLLPPSYKKELLQEENWRLTLILGILFLIFLVSLILVLISIKIYIQGQVESLRVLADLEEKSLKTSGIPDFREKITLANKKILGLESFYKTQDTTVEVLENIFQTIPAKIYLTSFFWQKSASQVSLSGFSPSREDLFELKKNLEEEKEFIDIRFPLSNWQKPADIDFTVTFKMVR